MKRFKLSWCLIAKTGHERSPNSREVVEEFHEKCKSNFANLPANSIISMDETCDYLYFLKVKRMIIKKQNIFWQKPVDLNELERRFYVLSDLVTRYEVYRGKKDFEIKLIFFKSKIIFLLLKTLEENFHWCDWYTTCLTISLIKEALMS